MRTFALLARTACAAIAITIALPAAAAPPKEKSAAALVARGKAAARQKKWGEAIASFKEADALDPNPQTKLELGRALVSAGKLVEAMRVLHAVSDAPAATPGARKVAEAGKKLLADTESRVPWITVSTVPNEAHISLDGASLEVG